MPPKAMTLRRTGLAIAAVTVAAVAMLILWPQRDPLRWSARRQWKDQAILRIQQRLDDPAWLERQRARVGPPTSRPYRMDWIGDELLVMKNGDWMICQNISSKQNWRIKDLFIGRGSDGKWYYSTFHFCVSKEVLRMEQWQPESLAQFVDAYWLFPFDTRSDDCLNTTWTGAEPYGEYKVESAQIRTDGSQ